jgi:hypothetical protein
MTMARLQAAVSGMAERILVANAAGRSTVTLDLDDAVLVYTLLWASFERIRELGEESPEIPPNPLEPPRKLSRAD